MTAEKDELAPLGNPEAEKEIGLLLPDFKAALIVFLIDEPLLIVVSPEFESEKSNCCSMVNEALASKLGLEFFLNAFAVTKVVAAIVNGPLYTVEDWVGVVPFMV